MRHFEYFSNNAVEAINKAAIISVPGICIPFGAENHDKLVKVVMLHSEGYLMMYGYLKL